ncbi:MAG: rhomboid family intramembrane serine protease [Actinomycetota bacterium]
MADPGAPTTATPCYRHTDRATAVRCTRCDRAICPECMVQAPVGFHCPTCVDEAREAFRSGGGGPVAVRNAPGGRIGSVPPATRALLVVLITAFALQVVIGQSPQALVREGALQPYLIAAGQWWRLFTAMFLHAGLLHIAFNGYALYAFGGLVESLFGPRRFIGLFLVTGFLASVASYAFGDLMMVGVGASGAIFGVFGAFVAWSLRRRRTAQGMASLRWAATLIVLNAVIAIGFQSIDWRAHLGGLVAGVVVGWSLEGFGPAAIRKWSPLLGTGAALAVGVVLLAMRTSQIRALDIFAYLTG